MAIGNLPAGVQSSPQLNTQLGKKIFLDDEAKVKNEKAGDALLFGIASEKYHRVEDVTRGGPRVVYVGWFFSRC